MKREWFTFIIGVLVFLIPFLGFPRVVNSIILGLAGLLLIVFSLQKIRQSYVSELGLNKSKSDMVYQSNMPTNEEVRP